MNKKDVDILILGNDRMVKAGHTVPGTLSGLRIPVSKKLLGRIVNPMGKIIDGGFPLLFSLDIALILMLKLLVLFLDKK